MGQGLGIVNRAPGAPGGGQQQGRHLVGAKGSGGQHRHQGRIDAAAEAQHRFLEAAFAAVVRQPQHQNPEELFSGVRGRGCLQRWFRCQSQGQGLGQGLRPHLPAGHGFGGAGQLQFHTAGGVNHKTGAIKDEFVVATDLVDVDHWHRQTGGGPGRQPASYGPFALAKR